MPRHSPVEPRNRQKDDLEALRHALIDGERSGVATPLDMEAVKRMARTKLAV